jgi:hypothetical protein
MTVPKRFGILRFIGTLLKVLAWIVLIVGVLGGVVVAVMGDTVTPLVASNLLLATLLGTQVGQITGGVGLVLLGLVDFLILYAAGERLHLQLAVEENTRLTAALLLRMHQESQQDTRATSSSYASGFSSEPFER